MKKEAQNGAQNNRAHALIVPYPAQGHISPMLQFSKRLVSKGVKTTFATTVFLSKSIHADPQSSTEIVTYSDGFDVGGYVEAGSAEAYHPKLREVGSRTVAAIIKKLQEDGHPIQAVVYDAFLPWALYVAKQFGLPGVAFFTQSCAVNSVYYHVQRGLLKLPIAEPFVSLPGLPKLELSELPSFVYQDFGAHPGFSDLVMNQFSNIHEADWVLFNHFYDLEREAVDWFAQQWKVKTIGPTVPSMYVDQRLQDDKGYGFHMYEPKTNTCISWLKDKPNESVVYVSFGSFAELSSEQTEELAWGLKNTNHYFLWVVRATEEAKLPKDFKEEVFEKGLIVTWCPQLDVLAHDSVGCFVTHCGFNSVLEALSIGVPMVAMPIWTDQPTNAKYVEEIWETGVRATQRDEKGIIRRQVIERSIKEVMEGEKRKQIKNNAIKWRNLAKQAVQEGGSSDKDIEEIVTILASQSSPNSNNGFSKSVGIN